LLLLSAGGAAAWSYVDNFGRVAPGVFRSAQPWRWVLRRRGRRYGIRTVLHLRGHNPPAPWYRRQRGVTGRFGVRQVDLPLDSAAPPAPAELRALIALLDGCERPLLLHCQSGIDRSGVAAVVCALLAEGGTPGQARGQLGLRYGGMPW